MRNLILLLLAVQNITCKPYKLDGNKVYKDMVKRGQKPQLKESSNILLVDGSKWRGENCSVKKNLYTLKVNRCQELEIDRGLCYGHCRSIIVPGSKLRVSSACLPTIKKVPVTLDCSRKGKRIKKVKFYEKIVACSCRRVTFNYEQFLRELEGRFRSSLA